MLEVLFITPLYILGGEFENMGGGEFHSLTALK